MGAVRLFRVYFDRAGEGRSQESVSHWDQVGIGSCWAVETRLMPCSASQIARCVTQLSGIHRSHLSLLIPFSIYSDVGNRSA